MPRAAPGALDTQSPTAQITFPPAGAATEASRIIVRGVANDDGTIAAVRVNGVLATTNDAFNTWQASVELVPGPNTLTVEAVDAAANSNATAAQVMVARSAVLPNPRLIDVDAPNNRAIVFDVATRSLVAIDLLSGLRTLVSSAPSPQDPNAVPFQALVLGLVVDSANNRALVLDARVNSDGGRIVAVNLSTGARTIFSGPTTPDTMTPFQSPRDIALCGNRALVVDNNLVVSVDLLTGRRSFLRISDTFERPFNSLTNIAVDIANNRAIVLDSPVEGGTSVPQLMAISFNRDMNGNTGARTPIPLPTNVDLRSVTKLVVDGAGQRVLATDGNGRVQEISLDGSTGSVLVTESRDPGDFFFATTIAIDAERKRALVANRRDAAGSIGEVVAIDLTSGGRTLLPDPARQSDVPFVSAFDVTYDAANSRALVLDNALNRIVALNLGNLGQGPVRSVIGTLPARPFPGNVALGGVGGTQGALGIALDTGSNRVLAIGLTDPNLQVFGTAVAGVDLNSGAISEVLTVFGILRAAQCFAVDNTTRRAFFVLAESPPIVTTASLSDRVMATSVNASGAPLMEPRRLVVDAVAERLFATDSNRVLSVDPLSGVATELAQMGDPTSTMLRGIVMDPSSGGLLVVESATRSIQAVSSAGGALSPVILGHGPNPFVDPDGIALDTKNNFLFIADRRGFVVLVDRLTNERVFF